MKFVAALFCLTAIIATSASASVDWVGNPKIKVNRRGSNYESTITERGLEVNICDYGVARIELEVYKAGVTDIGAAAWEKIDASMQTRQNETGKVIRTGRPNVIGRRGNNAVYEIYLPGMSPDAVTGLDPKSKDTTLEVYFDGQEGIFIPIKFSCVN